MHLQHVGFFQHAKHKKNSSYNKIWNFAPCITIQRVMNSSKYLWVQLIMNNGLMDMSFPLDRKDINYVCVFLPQ